MDLMDIRCFQHCRADINILCFSVPLICPLCGENVATTPMRIPPYLVNGPFTNAALTRCTLVIKPTIGSFLIDFTINSDLHIGVTDSRGRVYEFDEKGVSIGRTDWNLCISVDVVEINSDFCKYWDQSLEQFSQRRHWQAQCYDESRNNCFDFAIGFLQSVGLGKHYGCLIDRRLFCEQMIVPRTAKAGKFISLYRGIKQSEYIIQPVQNK